MSSSMRNAIQRRSHRERAQPLERQRLGLLEKHKDYRLRARDWAKKKATLQSLREKAAERNEDEFSHRMLSRGGGRGPGSALTRGSDEKRARNWDGTVSDGRRGAVLSLDTVRLLKTQDTGYLRTMRNLALKEVADLEERAALAAAWAGGDGGGLDDDEEDEEDARPRAAKPKRIVFAETAAERDEAVEGEMEPSEGEGDDDDDADDADDDSDSPAARARRRRADNAARLRRRLAEAKKRLAALTAAEHELDLQRARMAKTPTVVTHTRAGALIKSRQRKR